MKFKEKRRNEIKEREKKKERMKISKKYICMNGRIKIKKRYNEKEELKKDKL